MKCDKSTLPANANFGDLCANISQAFITVGVAGGMVISQFSLS